MDLWGLLGAMIIGGIAGWLAGKIMRGGGFGILGNIIIGVIGGLLGSWLFGLLNITFLQSWDGLGRSSQAWLALSSFCSSQAFSNAAEQNRLV